jgi:hypothetical protein
MDNKGKTSWIAILIVVLIIGVVYFLFVRENWATPISINGTIEAHNTLRGQAIKVGIYQYSGSPGNPLGNLIVERTVYTCTTTDGPETFSYKIGCLDSQITGNYFVVFVQSCPGGWKVLDVREGFVFTNVILVRSWGEAEGQL